MFLVLLMIFEPAPGWNRAVEASRSAPRLFFVHLLPLLLLGCVAEGYGMTHWGKRIGELGALRLYTTEQALRYEAVQFIIALLVTFASALTLKLLGNTFQARQRNLLPAIAVSLFALGPVWLARVADAFPAIHPWVSWVCGALIAFMLLYQGLPRLMQPDPSHAPGYYVAGVMVLLLSSAVGRLLALLCLQAPFLGLAAP